jgi:hypothetical protein
MIRQIIPKGENNLEYKIKVCAEIGELPSNRAWLVQVVQYRRKRSTEQNAFLHAVPLKLISEFTGHEMEDLKTYFLGECFGWQGFEMFGQQRKRPLKRSSELNTAEFSFFMEWIERWASNELGMIIPRPNEYLINEDTK